MKKKKENNTNDSFNNNNNNNDQSTLDISKCKFIPNFLYLTAIAAMHGPHSVFDMVTVRLYTVMPEVCRWLTNEKQRKTDIRLTALQFNLFFGA